MANKFHSKFNISGTNLEYRNYEVEIKEVNNDSILRPTFTGYADIEYIIEFFGLENPDVEWYKIYGVKNGNKELIKG